MEPRRAILYYLTIVIKNGSWLRQSILYWDVVQTIVPMGYQGDISRDERYPEDMRILASEGMYESVHSTSVISTEGEEFEQEFFISLESRAFQQQLPTGKNRILETLVYEGKVPSSVFARLKDLGLAQPGNDGHELALQRYLCDGHGGMHEVSRSARMPMALSFRRRVLA